ncbi:NADH dehydrogenase [ubiquinone] 1 alpha subcomplex subunit 5-like [Watersipora subatra]|uniref:NADH dehydrogenase [ubiquinone] 1 alpha subcomplex subunit 5-like n=1 Tax=Watersipora subatra TaxID=2589382 RepID=UPI00355B92B8
MAGVTKLTTCLTGLKVAKHPRASLLHYYDRILAVTSKMPKEAAYRVHTEAIVNTRQAIVNQEKDVSVIESKIGGGQIEELISQATKELSLSKKMLSWQPWEPLVEKAPKDQWKWPL